MTTGSYDASNWSLRWLLGHAGRGLGVTEAPHLRRVERKADVLHRGDPVLLHLLRVEVRANAVAVALRAQLERDVLVDADQPVELGSDPLGIGDFHEERGGELAFAGHQFVVHVELVLDLVRVRNALHPQHLLHLEAQGLAVLEEQRHVLSDGQTSLALVGDDGVAVGAAQRVVGVEPDHVLEGQELHVPPSP